jgi:beta-fructofuranosidase
VGGDIVKHWGHSTSADLLTWVDKDIAIPASARDGSIWSGSVVLDANNTSDLFPRESSTGDGNVLAYYTSWQPDQEQQHLAYSHDGGYTFSQYAYNPIISLSRHGFRDPKISYHHKTGKWVMVLTLENSVTFYTSTNLRDWIQVSVWDPQQWLGMIECPQILQMPVKGKDGSLKGSKWVLVLSLAGGGQNGGSAVKYIVGDFNGTTFTPDAPTTAQIKKREAEMGARAMFGASVNYATHEIDFGPDKYATAFFHFGDNKDANHDAYSISWATDSSYACCTPTDREGWRHCMNSVRRHWIDLGTNRIMSRPGGDESKLISTKPGWNPIVSQQGISGLEGNSSVIKNHNPAIMWDLTVRVQRSLLKANETASAQLIFQSSQSSGAETVAMQFDFAAPSAGSSDETDDTPIAKFKMSRSGLRGWDRGGEFAVQDVEALAVTSASGASADDFEFTLHGVMDRSIMEVYVNGGVEAGTLLFFAEGVMDSITLKRGKGAADQGLEFDFRAVALKSIWEAESPNKGGNGAQDPIEKAEFAVGEL